MKRLLLITSILATSTPAVWAQSNPSSEEVLFDEIVVEGVRFQTQAATATNVDAALIKTPATVNVIGDDLIKAIGARQFEDLIPYIPGAGTQGRGDPTGNRFNLRGFTVNQLTSGGIRIGNFQSPRRTYHFDEALYDRVEILKGTSAVLNGAAAPGGSLNYIRARPTEEFGFNVQGNLGSFDLLRGSADITGAILPNLSGRLTLIGQKGKLTVHGDSDGSGFSDDRFIFAPQLTWQTSTGGALYFSYEYSEVSTAFDPGVRRIDDGTILFGTNFTADENSNDAIHHVLTAEITQPLSDNLELFVGANIVRTSSDRIRFSSFFGPTDGSPATVFTELSDESHDQDEFKIEVRGDFTTGPIRHQTTLGFNFLETLTVVDRDRLSLDPIDPFNPAFPPFPFEEVNLVPNFQFGTDPEKRIYFQDYMTITENLNLFFGVSYLEYLEGFSRFNSNQQGFGEDEVFDFSFGGIYNINQIFNPYISFSTSTEVQRGLLSDGSLIPAREAEQFDGGIKSEWLNGRLSSSLSIFQIEQTNISEPDPDDETRTFSILSGTQRVRGVEFEISGNINDNLSLIGGFAHLNAEFIDGISANVGKAPFSVPENNFSVFAQYAFLNQLKGLTFGAGFVRETGRFGDNANSFELPDYDRIDLSVAYEADNGFTSRLSIENVFDEKYIAGSRGTANQLVQGAPRFLTLSIGYDY